MYIQNSRSSMGKRPFLAIIPLFLISLVLILSSILTYKHFSREIGSLGSVLSDLTSKANENERLKEELDQELSNLRREVGNLESQIQKNKIEQEKVLSKSQEEFSKQQACTKANELSQVPADMVFRTGGIDSCESYNFTPISSITKGALDYVNGYLKNYAETGSSPWLNSPEICLQDARANQPVLEARYGEYLKKQKLCGEP